MPRYRHPRGAAVAIDLGGERVVCDGDGTFESDDEAAVRTLAQAYDTTVADLRVDADADSAGESDESNVCTVVKNDGEVCGRDLPCPYHGGGDA